ncbi:hypothetical protein KCP75_13820 [Salmonella enterica subsp. enterica]|nr:hypothetical protein KCP75_13820 [Salmonella enterica subsp. enterica]
MRFAALAHSARDCRMSRRRAQRCMTLLTSQLALPGRQRFAYSRFIIVLPEFDAPCGNALRRLRRKLADNNCSALVANAAINRSAPVRSI